MLVKWYFLLFVARLRNVLTQTYCYAAVLDCWQQCRTWQSPDLLQFRQWQFHFRGFSVMQRQRKMSLTGQSPWRIQVRFVGFGRITLAPPSTVQKTTVRNAKLTEYIGWQWRNFFISYLCQLFFRHVVGQALQNVSYSDITFFVR